MFLPEENWKEKKKAYVTSFKEKKALFVIQGTTRAYKTIS